MSVLGGLLDVTAPVLVDAPEVEEPLLDTTELSDPSEGADVSVALLSVPVGPVLAVLVDGAIFVTGALLEAPAVLPAVAPDEVPLVGLTLLPIGAEVLVVSLLPTPDVGALSSLALHAHAIAKTLHNSALAGTNGAHSRSASSKRDNLNICRR
jgi:hypothetical protein